MALILSYSTLENRNLFWQKIIGYMQQQITAYDLQVYCLGLKRVLEDGRSFAMNAQIL